MSVDLNAFIRDIPDFPKPGILFKDITPLLSNHGAFDAAMTQFQKALEGKQIDVIVGMESRGFLFGVPLAQAMGVGFVPVRKPGKLPAETIAETYELEYGTDTLEIHSDAITEGQHVLIIDDLLATGGTASATERLVTRVGGKITAFAFLIELGFLKGRDKLNADVISLLNYDD